MPISRTPPESASPAGHRLPAGRRELFKLQAIKDFTLSVTRARDFDESLHLGLMVIMGTYGIVKGAMFLEEEGEFRLRVSRGLPPGLPPLDRSKGLLAMLRRSGRPIRLSGRGVGEEIRKAVDRVESAARTFSAEFLCPLRTRNGAFGLLLLGQRITGEPLTARQRETLGVMTSFLSSHVSSQRVLDDVSRLNDALRGKVLENERLLSGMEEIYFDTIRALATAIEAKDPYTRGHSERVAKLSVSIARELSLPEKEVQAIHIASILHDVGKIGTPRGILTKPSDLTDEEVGEIRRHPRTSFDILSEIRFPYPDVPQLARDHHEWLDGSGYPDGKRGREISIGARIIAMADAFDAMVSDRPYRTRLPLLDVLGEIRSCVHRHYDPTVARIFFRMVRKEIAGDSPGASVLPAAKKEDSRSETLDFLDRALRDLN